MTRLILFSILLTSCLSHKGASADLFDLEEIRDPSNLEVTVLKDWHPSKKEPTIRQKLIEITVCEWWDGQKIRLPVTLNAPVSGEVCSNVVIANQPLLNRPTLPARGQLQLLKEHNVGVILIGMGTIDAMEPKGVLHLGMKKNLLATKNPGYSPAWIWGISQMRALTAAMTEPTVFQPEKVLTTGGSKRGVASAAAGIHDDRFTAIMPIVAPPLGNPGTSDYVIGTEPEELVEVDHNFYRNLDNPGISRALKDREGRRAANRVTLKQATEANWSSTDIASITDQVWDSSRTADYLPELKKRGLDIFYNVGTNDSVSPALLELGKRYPDFPILIIPGGQHGGPATAGFTKRVPGVPEVESNFISFARLHFFGERKMIDTPEIVASFDRSSKTLTVTTEFSDSRSPETNTLWWNLNRSQPYTLPFEYDAWDSKEMKISAPGKYRAQVKIEEIPDRLDFLSVHTHTENQLPLMISSPYRRIDFETASVALIGDSTVTDAAGWGKAFANCFGENVTVNNFAMGGRSSKSWLAEGRLPKVREAMPDYMLIQFGHNGQPGKGPKRETDPASTYRDYLKIYIEEARLIGATPILLSSVTRRDFTSEGKIRTSKENPEPKMTRPLKPHADAARELAKEQGIPFIDLYRLSVEHHNQIGREASAKYSPKEGDITHFNAAGAKAIAGLIATELKHAEPNLAAFLK